MSQHKKDLDAIHILARRLPWIVVIVTLFAACIYILEAFLWGV